MRNQYGIFDIARKKAAPKRANEARLSTCPGLMKRAREARSVIDFDGAVHAPCV